MDGDNLNNAVKWTPELDSEGQTHLDELRAEFRPKFEAILRLRRELGLSQVEVADILQMTQSNVSKIERRGNVPISSLVRIARAKQARLKLVLEDDDGNERVSFFLS